MLDQIATLAPRDKIGSHASPELIAGIQQFIQAGTGRVELAVEDETVGIGAALFHIAQGAGAGPQDLLGSHITKE